MNTQNKIFVVIGSVAVLATASIGAYVLFKGDEATGLTTGTTASTSQTTTPTATTTSPSTSTTATTTTTTTSPSTSTTTTSGYKDSTYSATSSYSVPHGGYNSITASITVSGGKVTAVTTKNSYTDGESAMYIDSFDSRVSSVVVGSSLGSISLSRVGGASLTTQAFNSVIDQVISQAS